MEQLIFLLSQNYEMLIPIVVFVSFFASRQAYRLIHFIGISKKLFSQPNARSSHFVPVPQFGGVGLYFSTCMTASVFVALLVFHNFGGLADKVYKPGGVLAFISGLTLIFYTGFVDDLIDMKARLKFLFQVVSVAISCFLLMNSSIISLVYLALRNFQTPWLFPLLFLSIC